MKIGILGCGNLGRTLGLLWAEAGHSVHFASSDATKAQDLAQRSGGQGGSYSEVVGECEVLLYTLRGVAPPSLVDTPRIWRNKTLIDCNLEDIPHGFEFTPRPRSLAQELADQAPLCTVVKAFCLHPVELYQHGPASLREWNVQTFYCGDLPEAKQQVRQLALDLGLLPFDCGPLQRSHLLEGQGNFWRLFQLHQGQSLVSQFQLVGYPELVDSPYGGRLPTYSGNGGFDAPLDEPPP